MLRGALRDGNPGRTEHIWRFQLLKVNFSPQIYHLEDLYRDLCFPGMEVPFVLLLTRLVAEVAGKSTENSVLEQECCVGTLGSNGSSCPGSQGCSTGCFRSEDGSSSSCERCRNGSDCRDGSRGMNLSTATPFLQDTGSVAVALLVAPFVLSLFLILSVAAFFCLRRARSLPGLCYNNKASVLQPSETASMISPPTSSVRKPRYVRRDRSLGPPAPGPASSRVSNV